MIDENMRKKILLPYSDELLISSMGKQYARYYLIGGYNNYIYSSSSYASIGKQWQIVSYDVKNDLGMPFTAATSTLEKAKKILDDALIAAGCKLLNTEEEVAKYRCLI